MIMFISCDVAGTDPTDGRTLDDTEAELLVCCGCI